MAPGVVKVADFEGLLHALRLRRPRLVGVDGDMGAGKTTIATKIAERLSYSCIHLDSFMEKGRGSFLPSLRYKELRVAILRQRGPMVVEGICLLAALERISVTPDYLVFVDSIPRLLEAPRSTLLTMEVQEYLSRRSPRNRADRITSLEQLPMSYEANSNDVDIAFIRSKTMVAISLVCGGLAQALCGALMLALGVSQQGTATLKVLGIEISASGLGGIVMATSALWGYFAYLARPMYSRAKESVRTTKPDGTVETREHMWSTQASAHYEQSEKKRVPDASSFEDP